MLLLLMLSAVAVFVRFSVLTVLVLACSFSLALCVVVVHRSSTVHSPLKTASVLRRVLTLTFKYSCRVVLCEKVLFFVISDFFPPDGIGS